MIESKLSLAKRTRTLNNRWNMRKTGLIDVIIASFRSRDSLITECNHLTTLIVTYQNSRNYLSITEFLQNKVLYIELIKRNQIPGVVLSDEDLKFLQDANTVFRFNSVFNKSKKASND